MFSLSPQTSSKVAIIIPLEQSNVIRIAKEPVTEVPILCWFTEARDMHAHQ